ncbi:MAG TPA: lysophospholipid acyltransferase family protein [Polyangiaceae bacterium]|nr:lysophospholipid acyltransferase family protein [Polyangiaceae bacterium]
MSRDSFGPSLPRVFRAGPEAPPTWQRPLPSSPAWRVLRSVVALRRGAPLLGTQARAAQLKELCELICELHGIEVELRGRLPKQPSIVVANHLGYIDPVVLCALQPMSPIAKREISDWALVGAPLERLNVSFVRRGDAHSGARVLLRALRALRAGVSVLNFPEGTTSRGGLLPFHLGAFWLSRRTGLPVVPVAMDFEDMGLCWVDREAFLPHYAKAWWNGSSRRVRVSVGEPLHPEDYRSELDLSWAAQRSIMRGRCPYPGAASARLT